MIVDFMILVSLRFLLKYFDISPYMFGGIIIVTVFLLKVSYIKESLKSWDRYLLNSLFFQNILNQFFYIETNFFFTSFPSYFLSWVGLSTLLLVSILGWSCFIVGEISGVFQFISLIVFFMLAIYLRLRMQIFNYTHLHVDGPIVTWEDMLRQLDKFDQLCVSNRLDHNPSIRLMSMNLNSPQYTQVRGMHRFRTIASGIKRTLSQNPEAAVGVGSATGVVTLGTYQVEQERAMRQKEYDQREREFDQRERHHADVMQKADETNAIARETHRITQEAGRYGKRPPTGEVAFSNESPFLITFLDGKRVTDFLSDWF